MNNQAETEQYSLNSFLSMVEDVDTLIAQVVEQKEKIHEVKPELKEKITGDEVSEGADSPLIEYESILQDNSDPKVEKMSIESQLEMIDEKTTTDEDTIETSESPIVKQLKEIYEASTISFSEVYFAETEYDKDKIKSTVSSVLKSLEKVEIEQIDSIFFPYALNKLEGQFTGTFDLRFDDFFIPLPLSHQNENLKFQAVSQYKLDELTESEKEKWQTLLNQQQLSLLQLIAQGKIRELCTDDPLACNQLEIELDCIKHILAAGKEKIIQAHNSADVLLKNIPKIKERLDSGIIWETDEDFMAGIDSLKTQIKQKKTMLAKLNKEVNIRFLELRKIQNNLEAQTKKYKLLESKGLDIKREDKEKLAREVKNFQNKKHSINMQIASLKKDGKNIEIWEQIVESENKDKANDLLSNQFKQQIKHTIDQISDVSFINDCADDLIFKWTTTSISIRVIYVPLLVVRFKASQESQDITGIAVHLPAVHSTSLIRPFVG